MPLQSFCKIGQTIKGKVNGRMGKRDMRLGSLYKNGMNPRITPKFHITDIITHYQRMPGSYFRKFRFCLVKHTRIGLAVGVLVVIGCAVKIASIRPPAFSICSCMRWWISINVSSVIRPRPTPRWLVTTTIREKIEDKNFNASNTPS